MTPIRKIVRNALANVCWEMSGVVLDERTSTHSHIYYVYYSNKHQCIVIEASRIYVCICIYTYIRICRLLDGWTANSCPSVCGYVVFSQFMKTLPNIVKEKGMSDFLSNNLV